MTEKQVPDLQGIEKAIEKIRPYVAETPLVRSELLSRALEADVWLKNETVTPIASFKIRGALNAAIEADNASVRGIVTSSTGNHGQGVAYAARLLGMQADIFLPNPANPVKANMIRAFGAKLHEVGDDFDIAKSAAMEYASNSNLAFINDGEDVFVMEGAGTIGYEIASSLDSVDLVLVPMGGGNLASGCAVALKNLQPGCQVITVQAKGSPAMTESYHQRKPVECPIDTVADGLVTRVPANLALEMLWNYVDDAWLASDDELLRATHTLMESGHVLVEPAGAASLAGACQHSELMKGKRIVFILTGANISPDLLKDALSREPII
jgi:threonine dehydratase